MGLGRTGAYLVSESSRVKANNSKALSCGVDCSAHDISKLAFLTDYEIPWPA